MEINLEELSSSNLSDLSLDELTAYRKALNERMDEILATADAEQNGSLTDEQRESFDNCEVREREVAAELDKQREDEERRARQRARIAQLQTSAGRHAPSCTATDPDDGDGEQDSEHVASGEAHRTDETDLAAAARAPSPRLRPAGAQRSPRDRHQPDDPRRGRQQGRPRARRPLRTRHAWRRKGRAGHGGRRLRDGRLRRSAQLCAGADRAASAQIGGPADGTVGGPAGQRKPDAAQADRRRDGQLHRREHQHPAIPADRRPGESDGQEAGGSGPGFQRSVAVRLAQRRHDGPQRPVAVDGPGRGRGVHSQRRHGQRPEGSCVTGRRRPT